MAKVPVKALKALRYHGQRYPAGAELAMEQAHIDALPAGAVELVEVSATAPELTPPAKDAADKKAA
jgi:hypothetical protein